MTATPDTQETLNLVKHVRQESSKQVQDQMPALIAKLENIQAPQRQLLMSAKIAHQASTPTRMALQSASTGTATLHHETLPRRALVTQDTLALIVSVMAVHVQCV